MTDEKQDEENKDKSATQESETEETADQLKAQLEEQKKHIASLNRESAERRKKLEAFEKAEADRKASELSEIEKAEAKVKAAEADRLKLAEENKLLKMQSAFNSKVTALKLDFVNENAQADAFKSLDLEKVGDDLGGMDEAVKSLLKDRPYLFEKPEQTQQTNDGARRTKGNTQEQVNADVIAKKRKDYQPI